MKNIILIAGVAALAASAPVVAKPGQGHGNSHAKAAKGGKGKTRGYDSYERDYVRGGQNVYGYGAAGCPPGLAKKNNGCLPPGQAKKRFNVGQRLPYGYNGYTPYDQIPYDLRNQYNLDPYGRYIYDQNYVYGVDPRTNAITQILGALIR